MSVNKPKPYAGFEHWVHQLQMSAKMYLTVGLLIFTVLYLPLWLTLVAAFTDVSVFWYLDDWFFAALRAWASPGATMSIALGDHAELYKASEVAKVLGGRLKPELFKVFFFGAISFVVYAVSPPIIKYFRKRAEKDAETRHIRGPEVITAEELNALLKEEGGGTGGVTIGSVTLPREFETQHCLAVGTTGAGKTQMLTQVFEQLRAQGGRGIIYDFKGDWTERFYDPAKGDILFNPLDKRHVQWNLFAEAKTIMDLESIGYSLIPQAKSDNDKYFVDACRDVFVGILNYLWKSNKRTNKDLWDALTASAAQISAYLNHTAAGRSALKHISDPESKQTQGVLGSLMQYTKAFQFFGGQPGHFSVADCVENGRGWMFVVNTPAIKVTMAPVLSLIVDQTTKALLSLPDDRKRRFYMILDELGTLQKLDRLIDMLTLSRSKGGSLWLGVQDFGRIRDIYGKDIAETLVNNCNTLISFRVLSPETTEYISKAMAEREKSKVEESHSRGPEELKDGESISRKEHIEKIILPGEISTLPDLTAFIKVKHLNPAKIVIPLKIYESKNEIMQLRDEVVLPSGDSSNGDGAFEMKI